MGSKRLDTLWALHSNGYLAEITCRCGHSAMMDPQMLLAMCQTRKWGTNSFATLVPHLKCSACGRRGQVRIGPKPR